MNPQGWRLCNMIMENKAAKTFENVFLYFLRFVCILTVLYTLDLFSVLHCLVCDICCAPNWRNLCYCLQDTGNPPLCSCSKSGMWRSHNTCFVLIVNMVSGFNLPRICGCITEFPQCKYAFCIVIYISLVVPLCVC